MIFVARYYLGNSILRNGFPKKILALFSRHIVTLHTSARRSSTLRMADETTPLLSSNSSNRPVEVGFEPKNGSTASR